MNTLYRWKVELYNECGEHLHTCLIHSNNANPPPIVYYDGFLFYNADEGSHYDMIDEVIDLSSGVMEGVFPLKIIDRFE